MNDLKNENLDNKEQDNLDRQFLEDENTEYENEQIALKEKVSIMTKIKDSFTSRKFRGGAYATTISAIVIVMILLVNIFVTELGLKVDVSKEGMYTLTDTTKDYVKKIKDNITIYYLVTNGKEDATFSQIVKKYGEISDKIKVETKDPVLYPNFASQYTQDKVNDNSVLVVNKSKDRAKYVDYSDMLKTQMDYNTYQSQVTDIDVEGQVTSAIQYVTTDDLPVMYTVEGHGEAAVTDTLASAFKKANVTTNSLSTLTAKKVPDDCSILFINAPQNDFSEDEVNMIKDYLAKGGDAIMTVDYNAEGLVNFNKLLNYYGVSLVKGIVLEGKQGYYTGQYVNNLVPNIESHDITSPLKSKNTSVVVPSAVGIQKLDTARSTTDIKPLLTTSDSAYSKLDVNSKTVEKENGDIEGPFNLGVAITEKYEEKESKIIVYGSSLMLDEGILSSNSIGNLDLFLNTVNFVSEKQDTLAIRTRSVTQQYLSLNAAQVNFWALIIVIVIPVLTLAAGGYICIRRRKK